MLNILDRLVAREVLKGLLAVVGVLLLILMSNQFVRYLARATAGEISADTVFTLLGAATLGFLGLLFAPGFFFSVVLTLGRMYKDHEITAMMSCGMGMRRVYRGVLAVALPVALCVAVLSLYLMPWSEAQLSQIKRLQEHSTAFSLLVSGRFNEFRDGLVIFYVESVDHETQTLRNVFIQSEDEIIAARSGYQETDAETGDRYLVLVDGTRYVGAAGTPDYRVAEFARYGLLMEEDEQEVVEDDLDALPTEVLLGSGSPHAMAELHWRIAAPVSVIALALIAVPLSRSRPREGRYAKMVLALLVYIVYSNLLAVGKDMVEDQDVSVALGMWWVHGLVLCASLVLGMRRRGRRWRRYRPVAPVAGR
jgi:lipopolysaccharide export system permease protein